MLRLAATPPAVARIFALTALDQVIPVYPTVDDALVVEQPVPAATDERVP